ncbi:MAG: tetratricopeptide repeat protein [Pseudomonadota bacterium]
MNAHVGHRYLMKKILAAAVLLTCASAFAEDVQVVKALMRDGKLPEALVQANKGLERRQNDPGLRFVKGLILSEQKKTIEAIDIFSKLTVDHPDYPEPYNNLAVLFATEGQYAKARLALDTALKLNPKYATAHENLGDVYLQSALQAYSDAAKNESDSSSLKLKLKSVRQTLGLPARESMTASATGTNGATAAMAKNAPVTAMPAIQAATKTTANSPASNNAGQGTQAERERVLAVVGEWVKAWSTKDIDTYLSLYADDFRTPNGESREAWKKMRRSRIDGKEQIEVQVLSPSVVIEDKTALVNFQQVYVAGKLSSKARKVLTLKNQNGTWKIVQEKSDG